MSEPIISVSGLRGTIGEQLTPVVAANYVAAWATTLPKGRIVVSRDGRQSGAMLGSAVCSSLQAHGFDVIDLGVAATPTVGVMVRTEQAVGGVQISASHNPRPYNGLKLFNSNGRVLPRSEGERVLDAYRRRASAWVSVENLGTFQQLADPHAKHLELLLSRIDTSPIQNQTIPVLLDSNHGAGSLLGQRLLSTLGCHTKILGGEPNGDFAHPPEPLAENLQDVCAEVKAGGFQVGFCQDPDADRLAIIDERGMYIGEELTLALCLMQVLPSNPGTVVTNCATSSLAKFVASANRSQVRQSAVGEANVADLMLAENAVFGGEGNGGPIDPQVGFVRDSFVGMCRILHLLATTGQAVSQLVSQLPPLTMYKDKIDMSAESLPEFFALLQHAMPDAKASMPDGLKLEWEHQWLLVRGSNTEPIVRLIAEAVDLASAKALCNQARELVNLPQV